MRARLKASLLEKGVSPIDAAWTDEVLDPTRSDHRFRPPLRHLQAGHAAPVTA